MYVIPQTPELRGVSPPWAPYQGSVLDTLRNLKQSPDPSPTHAPLIPNPGSAPEYSYYFIYVKDRIY
jgi:hypothetical protein